MRECPKCRACFDGIEIRCALDTCDLVETAPIERSIGDRYRIDFRIGEGRRGAVYRGERLDTHENVAIKLMLPHRIMSSTTGEKFQRRASLAVQLEHPNLARILDSGVIEAGEFGFCYIVSEYIEGWPLSAVISDQKRLSIGYTAEILEDVCAGLAYAHAAGIAHGALKPQNILLTSEGVERETVKLLDCGLEIDGGSEILQDSFNLSWPEAAKTACWYYSPEQCEGRAPDARSDIYSLGAIAYEMLTGAPPFMGEPDQVRRKHINSKPRSLWLWHRIPRKASAAINKALTKNPDRRCRSADQFIDDLFKAIG